MKILHLSSTFPRFKNDTTRKFIFHLCRELAKLGNEVHVVAPHDKDSKKFEILDDVNIHRFQYFYPGSYQKLAYGPGIPYNFKTSIIAKFQAPFFYISEYYKTLELVQKHSFDIIHGHWLFPQGHIAEKIGLKYKKKSVVSVHGAGLKLINYPILRGMCEGTFRKADHVIANSPYTYEISRKYSGKISMIPQGVDTTFFHPRGKNEFSDPRRKFVVLFVGRLVQLKGLEYLLSASQNVSNNIEVRIVGDGPLRNDVETLARRGIVNYIGEMDHASLLKEYQNCDALILPSIVTDTGETEALGVVLLEAMACGKPVIGSSVGGIPFIVRDGYNGLLIEPRSVEGILNAINYYVINPNEKESHSTNALKTAQKYSWKNIAKSHMNVYNDLLNQ